MKYFKLILCTVFCFYVLLSFSCTFAGDADNIDFNNAIMHEDVNALGDFDDLTDDIYSISPGEVYNIDKDYSLNGEISQGPIFITIAKDNVTINGNGHVIDGENSSVSFRITGKNVVISNLNFINFKSLGTAVEVPVFGLYPTNAIDTPTSCEFTSNSFSTIQWMGDNGTISGCTFYENTAVNGGALRWSGNNGNIDDCIFANNTALGVGGAVYVGGVNNTIANSIFINSTSRLSGEAIYFDWQREKITLKNNAYKNCKLYIDGAALNIDVDRFLYYSYMAQVADESVDLIPMIFSIIANGGLNYLDNGILYYGEYNDKDREFNLHITKYFGDISFTKNYKFKNLVDYNRIFEDLIYYGDYENTLTFIKNIDIYSSIRANDDYRDAISTNLACFNTIIAYLYGITDMSLINSNIVLAGSVSDFHPTFGLNINFHGALSISCSRSFDLNACGFDIVNINGYGTKIYTKSDDSDENKWAILGENKILSVTDLIVEGYNTAIENFGGDCILNSVTFNNNRMDYWIYRDYGAAIISTGIVECKDCTFTNNYAKYGGAVFNQGIISLENCRFKNNKAYGKIGNDVCNGKGGIAVINNVVTLHDTNIISYCDKTAKQNFIATFIDSIKGCEKLIEFIEGLFDFNEIDEGVSSLYPNKLCLEGLNVMTTIYSATNVEITDYMI